MCADTRNLDETLNGNRGLNLEFNVHSLFLAAVPPKSQSIDSRSLMTAGGTLSWTSHRHPVLLNHGRVAESSTIRRPLTQFA